MNGMPWIKLYTSHLDDPRLAVLDAETQLCYYKLTMLAGLLDTGGALNIQGRKLTEDEIAWQLREKNVKKVSQWLKNLKRAGLMLMNGHGWEMSGWMDMQGPAQSEKRAAWKERQDRHREGLSSHADVTSDKDVTHARTPLTRPESRIQSPESRLKSKRREDLPTPPPPSSRKKKDSGLADGRKDVIDLSLLSSSNEFNKTQSKRAAMIAPILISLGLRNPRLENLLVILATRSSILEKDLKSYVLAGIASAYADPTAGNKAAIAAHRLEADNVQPQFLNERSWIDIPDPIRKAAGLKLEAKKSKEAKRYTEGLYSEFINGGKRAIKKK